MLLIFLMSVLVFLKQVSFSNSIISLPRLLSIYGCPNLLVGGEGCLGLMIIE